MPDTRAFLDAIIANPGDDAPGLIYANRGAEALADSPRLKDLTVLDLSSKPLGTDSVMALAQSPHLVKVVRLVVMANSMTTAGARALARSPHLSQLTALRVSRSDLRGVTLTELRDRFRAGLEVW